MSIDRYEIYGVRHVPYRRLARENFLGGGLQDRGPSRLDYFVWAIVDNSRA